MVHDWEVSSSTPGSSIFFIENPDKFRMENKPALDSFKQSMVQNKFYFCAREAML